MAPDNEHNENNRFRGIKPETEEKYRQAMELYRSTRLSCAEISRICKVTVSGFQCYLSLYHRDLLLARYNITCGKKEGSRIKLGPLCGQLSATHVKYKDVIEACESPDYIKYNVSQIAREFGLEGTNLGRRHALFRSHRMARGDTQAAGFEWQPAAGHTLILQRAVRQGCGTPAFGPLYHGTGGRRILRCFLLRFGTAPAVLPQESGEAVHQNSRESRSATAKR